MRPRIRKLLLDIILSCKEISDFISGKTFDDFEKDRILQLAIERQFEIIGEALSRLNKIDEANLSLKIPEYRKIIDFRNIISHGYDIIDIEIIWDFAVNNAPDLLSKAENY